VSGGRGRRRTRALEGAEEVVRHGKRAVVVEGERRRRRRRKRRRRRGYCYYC